MSSSWSLMGPRRRGMSGLKILGIVFLVLILLCGGVITYVTLNARRLMAGWMRGPMVEAIKSTHLPEDQKTRLSDIINQVMDDFESGAISYTQVGELTQELAQGPFFSLIMVEMVKAKHLDMFELKEKERAEVTLTFDRFERGVQEGTIADKKVAAVLEKVSEKGDDDSPTLKDKLSEEDLNAFVTAMKEAADEAEIPMESYQVDFAGELQRVVDEVLGTGAESAPAGESTTGDTQPAPSGVAATRPGL